MARAGLNTPGPGEYPVKGIKDEVTKKVKGKQEIFGTTEMRFAQYSSTVGSVNDY
jgi:hypothetical protein